MLTCATQDTFNNCVLDYTFRLVNSRFHVSSRQLGKSH